MASPPLQVVIARLTVPLPLLLARAARASGDEEEPIGRLGGRRSSPGVRVFDCHSGWQPAKDDQQPEEDCDAAESVRTNVYVMFVSPGAEDQRNAYSVEVPRVGWVDSDARLREWQTDTQQLIEWLAVQAPQLAGRPVTVARWTVLCRSCRTP